MGKDKHRSEPVPSHTTCVRFFCSSLERTDFTASSVCPLVYVAKRHLPLSRMVPGDLVRREPQEASGVVVEDVAFLRRRQERG